MKVTIVGAGNVGASCADVISYRGIASEVVLLDIKEGFAEGKAMDIMQCATTTGFNTQVSGVTNDYSKTANSDVVVITSGIPRKPGMTREELIGINAGIVKSVAENILKFSPNTIIVVVSNPMDTMTYLTLKATGLPKNRIIGMGGSIVIVLLLKWSINRPRPLEFYHLVQSYGASFPSAVEKDDDAAGSGRYDRSFQKYIERGTQRSDCRH
jgi:malate/lactate dehydrogenase